MRRQLRVRLQLLYCTDELLLLNGSDFRELSRYKPSTAPPAPVDLPAPWISEICFLSLCVPDPLFWLSSVF